jgi:RNA polymerase sigma-70 factor (ECF subfamily)
MGLEPEQIAQILLRERNRLISLAEGIVCDGHTADDIFQQVVVAALEVRCQFSNPKHLLGWAVTSTRHRAVDAARRWRTCLLTDDVLDLLEAEWSDSTERISDQAEALSRCLEQLTPTARDLLRLRYEEGLTAPMIARRQGRTADAVYHSLSWIYSVLRRCIQRKLAPAGR